MYKKILLPLFVLCVIFLVGFFLIDREEHTIPFVVIQTGDDLLSVPQTPAWAAIYPLSSQSYVAWTGYTNDWSFLAWKFKPNNGTLIVRDMDIVGWFTSIDMSSLSINEDSSAWWEWSTSYLRDVFFSAQEYPTARFVHKAHSWGNLVIGDLTIMDTTHQVLFPMNFVFTGDMLVGDAYFVIDRQQRWLTGLSDFLDSYMQISLHFVWEAIQR